MGSSVPRSGDLVRLAAARYGPGLMVAGCADRGSPAERAARGRRGAASRPPAGTPALGPHTCVLHTLQAEKTVWEPTVTSRDREPNGIDQSGTRETSWVIIAADDPSQYRPTLV